MVYLVCYDVVSDHRRRRVAKLLERYGIRVQKSVFECVLNGDQYQIVDQQLSSLLKADEDQLRFYPLTDHCRQKVKVLGLQPDFVVDDVAFVV